MNLQNKFREMVKYRAGALCLIGILSATFLHTTTFMSQFFYGNIILGAIAAFAIDAGVVAMSIFKDELLKDGELAWMVRVTTSIVLFASGVANMSEGFISAYGIPLTYPNFLATDWMTITQWLCGTVIFPILAYVMCDTIGTRNLVQFRQEKLARNIGHTQRPKANRSANPEKSNKRQRIQELELYLESYPDASLAEMADAIGVSSRETVRKYLTELGDSENGAPKRSKNSIGFQSSKSDRFTADDAAAGRNSRASKTQALMSHAKHLHSEGWTNREIAGEIGRHETTISKWKNQGWKV